MSVNPEEAHYFIDETGQPTIFNKRKEVVIGVKNVSRFFIIGFLYSDTPNHLSRELVRLRWSLLKDPYFINVPSMQPYAKKTYYSFHATDDCNEVRHQVFKFLREYNNLRFLACVADKMQVLNYIKQQSLIDASFHYTENKLYDFLIRRLMRDQLVKSSHYCVHIANRGKKDRTKQLIQALEHAQKRYRERWGKETGSTFDLISLYPKQHAGLQAVDYFLWGLQRLYEMKDNTYVEYLWRHYRLVIDMHDNRENKKGKYYNQNTPLTIDAITNRD